MDRFGPRMDTGNNFIGAQIAQGRLAQGGDAAKGVEVPNPAIMSPKVVSYIASAAPTGAPTFSPSTSSRP